jgi:hypothetical protein
MTDQRQLFRSLASIKRRTIRVGGGKLYSWHIGVCELRVPSGRTVLLKDVLFVSNLSVNLLSSRKICAQPGVKGSFDSQTMYFTRRNEKIIRADIQGGIYIVLWIAKGLEETAFCTTAPVKVDQLLLQPKVVESQRLRTNITESQLLQSKTVDPQPPKSIQAIRKPNSQALTPISPAGRVKPNSANPSSVKPAETKEHCNH